jgi:Flp pilus assembly protein TadD
MDAPLKELERMQTLQEQARTLLEQGQPQAALAAAEDALALEPQNVRSLTLKAEALEGLGQAEPAEQLRALVKQLKRDAWQRQVEAEVRGRHDLMGEAIRHEKL